MMEAGKTSGGLPTDRLASEARNLLGAVAQRSVSSVRHKVGKTVKGIAEQQANAGPGAKSAASGVKALAEGKSPMRAVLSAGMTGLKEKVKRVFGGGKGGKKALKLTNIVEQLDVGVPLRFAYDQWTQFEDFPSFMKKLESAEQTEDEKLNWKAQVFWSHRTWEATIQEQIPDTHIIWRSKGAKGHVDGAVTFSELAPNLTRVLVVMEYHPQGFFEHTGNLWRAQGRRVRLELKHYRRHVMAHALLDPDSVQGWRGEIRDGEVVKSHEDALKEEQRAQRESGEREKSRAGRDAKKADAKQDAKQEDAKKADEERRPLRRPTRRFADDEGKEERPPRRPRGRPASEEVEERTTRPRRRSASAEEESRRPAPRRR